MKQKLNSNLKLPIFSWLFFLFLSSGVSYYHDNLQFGKPVQIERVDQLILNSAKKKNVTRFSVNSEKRLPDRLNYQYLQKNLLSQKLEKYIHIYLNRQFSLFKSINQNTIPHFRSRDLAPHSSDDFPDFIS
ncbi:MAG: hypothetical protein ABIN24_12325 [Dyadobacter sp.]